MLHIDNFEAGVSVRGKINQAFDDVAALQATASRSFDTVAALLADTGLTYAAAPAGTIVEAGGFRYEVAASAATDHHVTTAGGVKLYVLPGANGASIDAFGAVGNGVTDDRAVFIKAEASGLKPIRLSRSYFLSSNTGNTAAIYEFAPSAIVTMGTGLFQPSRYTDSDTKTMSQRVNFSSTNPVPSEFTGYQLLDGYVREDYLINQWGKQNLTTHAATDRSGVNAQLVRIVHAGEGDGYGTFWSAAGTAHPRISLATSWTDFNSTGMGGGQGQALSAKVALYGFGDVKLDDKGYADVAMLNYVGFTTRDGADTVAYHVPRIGSLQVNSGALSIDTFYLASGKANTAFDATQSTVDWGAFAMRAGQAILFDATRGTSGVGEFAATAAGNYTLSKPPGVNAFVFTRGGDDADTLRVAGTSATARATIGSAATFAYFSAHTTGSDSTTISLRTANAGAMGDRFVVDASGTVNVATAGARLNMAGVSVLNARQTGWTAPTGTATRTTFATSTVTTEQLAQRVKGLIDDLITHGLIGA